MYSKLSLPFLFLFTLTTSALAANEAASLVNGCRATGVDEPCYYRYRYTPQTCSNGKCSKLVIFFSGGEMFCDDSFGDDTSEYSKVLRGYNEKGYLAVCAGIFLNSETAVSGTFYDEVPRVDALIKAIRGSKFVQDHWNGDYLLLGGISHGATAPVVAMARTRLEEQGQWKGTFSTGACFLDGAYSPVQADIFLRNATPPANRPEACSDLRDRVICERYFERPGCRPMRPADAGNDDVLAVSVSQFQIANWKLVECGSALAISPCVGDMVPAAPIQRLCSSLQAGGKSCSYGSLPYESHMSCMSGGGIASCRDWFDELVSRPPLPPSSLFGLVSGSAVQLRWRDSSSDEEGFEIERKLEGESAFRRIRTEAKDVTARTDGSLPDGNHFYRVRAFRRNLFSSYSNVISVRIATPPAAPSGLTVTLRPRGFDLSWNDNSANEYGFEVERSYPNSTTYLWTGRSARNVSTYVDLGNFGPGLYRFRVRSFNAEGKSSYSNVFSIRR